MFASARRRTERSLDFREVLGRVGQSGELVSKARESLVSLNRLLAFVQQSSTVTMTQEARTRFRTLSRDVIAMSDHSSFLGDKVTFVLDATLGMVTIDQNNILKIFSVVTVFLLPPSVIAGVFGMNFEHMPWLHDGWGFLAAARIDGGVSRAAVAVVQAQTLALSRRSKTTEHREHPRTKRDEQRDVALLACR